MLRSKLLLLIMSGVLIFASCTDSGTNPDNNEEEGGGDENTEEPVEPTASVNNPSDGAMLEGEITLSVTGESENGFDEIRIYVGDEEVETIDSPTMPYDYTLTTYEFNNGDYDLKAELDPTDQDTTVDASVSTTFENYMVTLKTDGYINYLKEYNDAAYMFIADPQGNVLREMELTAESDGTFKLLPPSSFDGDAPEHYSMTIGRKTTDFQGNDAFYLDTDVGLESWNMINKSGSVSSGSSEPPATRDVEFQLTNFDKEPYFTQFSTDMYPQYGFYTDFHSSDLTKTIPVPENSEDLVIVNNQNPETVSNPQPIYKWIKDPENLESPIKYDVSKDFKEMKTHSVANTSDIKIDFYYLWMTIAPESFENGDMIFSYGSPFIMGDANGSDSGYGLWVPEITERSFLTTMYATNKSNSNISYTYQTPVMKGFPDDFFIVEADVNITNQEMDNVAMDISGSADFIDLYANASGDTYTQNWGVTVPDTTSSFVFPKIADSLDSSVNNYNRADFTFTSVTSVDYHKFENGYSSYLEWQYGTKDFGVIIGHADKTKALNTGSNEVKYEPKKARFGDRPEIHSPFKNNMGVREGIIPKRIR